MNPTTPTELPVVILLLILMLMLMLPGCPPPPPRSRSAAPQPVSRLAVPQTLETAPYRPAPTLLSPPGYWGEDPCPQDLVYYVVQPGDTLFRIAQWFYGDARKYPLLLEANRNLISRAAQLQAGMILTIPTKEDK